MIVCPVRDGCAYRVSPACRSLLWSVRSAHRSSSASAALRSSACFACRSEASELSLADRAASWETTRLFTVSLNSATKASLSLKGEDSQKRGPPAFLTELVWRIATRPHVRDGVLRPVISDCQLTAGSSGCRESDAPLPEPDQVELHSAVSWRLPAASAFPRG